MRVLTLVSSLDPERGGTQTGATNMAVATLRAGVDHVVVAGGNAPARKRALPLTERLESEGAEVKQFPSLPWPPERPDRWGLSLPLVGWVAARVAKFDLLHIHGAWGLALLSGLGAARLRRTPIVVTPHESFTAFDIDDSRSDARRRQKLGLKRRYLRAARMFIVQSELEAGASMPQSDRDRLRVVPYPVFDDRRPVPELRPRGGESGLRVGFLGRIHEKKNLDLLIDAVAAMPGHVRLIVAGEGYGDIPERMKARAERAGLGSRVEWLGFVSGGQRDRFFDGLDLLAMPSAFESFGMSAAEAMLHGVPVLVSERTGVAEVIRRHGGGVIAPAAAEAVVEKLTELDRERDSLTGIGAEGQAGVLADLSSSTIGGQLRSAYEAATNEDHVEQ